MGSQPVGLEVPKVERCVHCIFVTTATYQILEGD